MLEQNIGEDEAYPELTEAEARAKGPMIALIQNVVKTRHIEEDAGSGARVVGISAWVGRCISQASSRRLCHGRHRTGIGEDVKGRLVTDA